jgi:hypothetical protein
MNIFVWILQGLMGLFFLRHGIDMIKLADLLRERAPWATELADWQRKAIGIAEMLGGLGLILPGLFGIYTFLTPISAGGLALTMISSIVYHLQRKDESRALVMNFVLLFFTGIIAYYRWIVLPL